MLENIRIKKNHCDLKRDLKRLSNPYVFGPEMILNQRVMGLKACQTHIYMGSTHNYT
jgi:hypothetical protein